MIMVTGAKHPMSTTLYWFSSTGNSLRIARDLADALGDTCLIPVPKALADKSPATGDTIGFVFPVYIFGMPKIMVEFVNQLEIPKEAYVFAVATFGGMPGATLLQLRDILAGKGITLKAGFGITMPGNYTPLYGAPSNAAQQKMFAKASARIPEITALVKSRKAGPVMASNWLVNLIFFKGMYKAGMPRIGESDKKFYATTACNSCGLCQGVCPVHNIVIRDGRPVWQGHCEQCMACLQWCPKEAIQFGQKTVSRKRYRHPDFVAADFMVGQ